MTYATDTLPAAGAAIAVDRISSQDFQRLKVAFGVENSATDVSSTNPLPTVDPDSSYSGTITVTDAVVAAPGGAGAFVSGASTSGSLVSALTPGGDSAWCVQITGLTSGTLHFEGSLDSTTGTDGNWININGRQTGIVNTVLAGNATANGLYRGNTSGLKYFRVRSVGALTGTPAIVIRITSGAGAVFLNASIPSGTNNIGDVDVLTLPTLAALTGSSVAHDGVDSGNPHKVGAKAIAHGTNPAAVAAADRTDLYANRAGVPFVIGGHPNIVTVRATYAASAQTNAAIITVATGLKIVVTRIRVAVSNSTTNTPLVRIGFATATTPTTTGVLFSHPGIPGGGYPGDGDGSGILGVGADDEDVRITSDAATSGTIDVVISYYTIES